MAIKRTALKRHPNVYEYETKRGKRYSVRRTYFDVFGKKQEFTKSGFLNWRDAEQALRKFETSLYDGSIANSEMSKITLNDYFEAMAKRKAELGIWRISTDKRTRSVYNTYFRESFGDKNIADISRRGYQHFIDQITLKKNLHKNTINQVNATMQQIMNDAEKNNVIRKNMLHGIDIIGGQPPKDQALTQAQYDAIMDYAKNNLSRYDYAFIQIMALGERRGELMGLKTRSSFKFEKDEINNTDVCAITFNQARTADEPNGTDLKNQSSYRTIYVTGELVELIKYAIKKSDSILADHGLPISQDHYLWLNPATGNVYHVQFANTILKKIERGTGIKVHPHQLRHFFATIARSNKMSPTDTMHWLGHSSLQMTDSYTRETPEGAKALYEGLRSNLVGTKKKNS